MGMDDNMWERTKTLLLVGLVVTSVFFTGQMWLGSLSSITEHQIGIDYQQPQPAEALKPLAIYTHRNNQIEKFNPKDEGYSQLWQMFQEAIAGTTSVTARVVKAEEWNSNIGSGAIEISLAGSVPMRMWLEALSVQPSGLSTEHFIDRILLNPKSTSIYFFNTKSGVYLAWTVTVPKDKISTIVEAVAGSGQAVRLVFQPWRKRVAPWVYVPSSVMSLAELLVTTETSAASQYALRYFEDRSLVRVIGERDGKTTYTDGRKIVYVDIQGGIEFIEAIYFARPQYDVTKRGSLMLSDAMTQIAKYGGWPGDYLLSSMTVNNDPLRPYIDFRFTPFVTGQLVDEKMYLPLVSSRVQLGLRVTEKGVSQYERFVFIPERLGPWKAQLCTAEAALSAAAKVSASTKNILQPGIVTNIYLAYYQREIEQDGYLYPVWVIEQGTHRVLVNAFTSQLVGD
ncbi:MAG: two-component system activity regulator YycH [bacterium]|nr:two-component system activity regulator YycH [bacterium]